ncbi:MAG: ATP-binding protein [Leptospiraceae bacterium]|nr:ATP-binding protein [Leptospiraceae bacterium]MDW7976188.1 ATP-binding protein [Leptospiraceae bacterium]
MQHIFNEIKKDLETNAYHYGKENCSICHGLGIITEETLDPNVGTIYRLCQCVEDMTLCDGNPPYEYYDPNENRMKECPSKKARIALKKIHQLEKQSGIPERYKNKFLTSIDTTFLENEDYYFAIDNVHNLLKNYKEKRGNQYGLYLYGNTGTGKTFLACIILNELIRLYQVRVRYAKISRDIIGKIRDSFNPQSEYYGEGRKIEEELANVEVLVIDDFGVQRETPWVNNVLYDLIDTRYEKNLLTILTSNEPMEAWKEISNGRIYSRLKEMCLEIQLNADDYRLKKSKSYR